MFAAVGIWLGYRLTRRPDTVVVREVVVPAPSTFVRDDRKPEALGITPRELEVLELIAAGLSNRHAAGAAARGLLFALVSAGMLSRKQRVETATAPA